MEKLILIRYAELSTKKSNIKLFLNKLKENISFALNDIDYTIYFDKGRMFIETNEYDINLLLDHSTGDSILAKNVIKSIRFAR